mgnify:CR=1 FL=1|jgi:hypothetical protein
MNKAERRSRTEKIAKKRFRRLYCNYHGTPENWLFYRKSQKDRDVLYGKCRNGVNSWRCRCEYCLGRVFRAQSIADLNFREGLQDAMELNISFSMAFPNVLDPSSTGPYDWGHEKWHLQVCPWPSAWNMGNRFHNQK